MFLIWLSCQESFVLFLLALMLSLLVKLCIKEQVWAGNSKESEKCILGRANEGWRESFLPSEVLTSVPLHWSLLPGTSDLSDHFASVICKEIWAPALPLASLERSCCLLPVFPFSPVEETINHWWVLYLNDSAAPPMGEPGCNQVTGGNNSCSLVPFQQQQSMQKHCGLVDWTGNPGSLFSKPHGAALSLLCFWRSIWHLAAVGLSLCCPRIKINEYAVRVSLYSIYSCIIKNSMLYKYIINNI